MTRITCTRRLEFDAAHREINHESKCKYLHGHRYAVEVTFEAEELDAIGRVIDFGVVKQVLGKWLDDNWDHTAVLCVRDKELGDQLARLTQQHVYYMRENPTAENMARHLLEDVCPTLFKGKGLRCTRVWIQETPNCFAEAVSEEE